MKVTHYTIQDTFNLKIAVVSDLHERNADAVIECLKEIKPDIICCPGDMLERTDIGHDKRSTSDYSKLSHFLHKCMHWLNDFLYKLFDTEGNPCSENTYHFFEECKNIAPVFYSLGNHEYYLNDIDKKVLKENSITLLDNESIYFKGIHIGGCSPNINIEFINEFSTNHGFKLLLCHHPEFYDKYLKDKDIDCILSGHAHGGQIRIFNQGIFSPNQGLFPKYTKGKYGNMIVSTGCSNTAAIPRWNNPEEILLVEIKNCEK